MLPEHNYFAGGYVKTLLIDLGVFEAEEVEDAVETDGAKVLLGGSFDLRFGVVGDAEAGGADHREVVRAVADSH